MLMQQAQHGGRKHHPRQIIVGKEKLRLISTRGDNHAAGAQMQQGLRIGPVIIDLHCAQQIAFVQTKTAAVHKGCDHWVDQDFFHQHGIPSKPRLFFQQCHLHASFGGCQSSLYPMQTATDHNHIKLQVGMLVMMC